LAEIKEKLKNVTAQLEAVQIAHTELARTHSRLLTIKEKDIHEWLFAGADAVDAL
jgi:hypothetical protein